MQINQRWMKSLALTASVLGMTGAVHAQSLLSSTWNSVNTSTFVGSPIFSTATFNTAISSNGPASGTGVGSLATPGSFVNVSFVQGLNVTLASGAGVNTGSNTGSFTFVTNTGNATINVPINYSINNGVTSSITSSVVGTNFIIGGTPFSFVLNPLNNQTLAFSGGGTVNLLTMTGTVRNISNAPEPGTLALLGLGIAPITVAIRRRRK
jgi:hypothetical protein